MTPRLPLCNDADIKVEYSVVCTNKAVTIVDPFICASFKRRRHTHYGYVHYFTALSAVRIYNGGMINELESIWKGTALA